MTPNEQQSPTTRTERRASVRFGIRRSLYYRAFDTGRPQSGSGETVNISSKGVLIQCDKAPSAGQKIELSIDWPVALENRTPLQLVIVGVVVRAGRDHAAVAIDRYEFRTRSREKFAHAAGWASRPTVTTSVPLTAQTPRAHSSAETN